LRSEVFFDTHPVFTLDEFHAARLETGAKLSTSKNLLAKHVASGRLARVRRGLYATVPRGVSPELVTVDPYLLAGHLAPDAVVAYHAALQFFGKTYSVWSRFHYLTRDRRRATAEQGAEFVPVQDPAPLRVLADRGGGVLERPHAGGHLRVTTLERAMVDVLHEPERAGGWEEVWRSLEMIEYVDLDAVVAHALGLGSALTVARVGLFLEQHADALMVEEKYLEILGRHAPRQPRYLDATHASGRLVHPWNLVVPEYVLERGWEEQS
jgi:predicted transcriptional regulator of viral defense system